MHNFEIITTFDDAKKMTESGSYSIVPIAAEILSDMLTPIKVMTRLKEASHHCFMLESVDSAKKWGRYTFLGYEPSMEITCTDGKLRIKNGDVKQFENVNPREYIKKILREYKSPHCSNLPTFTGGLVGYFSYDYIKYSEPQLKLDAEDTENFKDVDLMLFDKVIAFDSNMQKVFIIINIAVDNLTENYKKACDELKEISELIINGKSHKSEPLKLKSEIKPLFTKVEYCSMVEKAKKYIYDGDIFQVVLSNRLEAEAEGSLFDTYRILRTENPSPYMFYFSSDDVEIAGASPETLVRLDNGVLHTYPLAGTRPRGKSEDEDLALKYDLLSDEKELAEHNMLVDLGRNDIGRISKIGTVEVDKYMEVQYFSKVMHIGSSVKGELADDKDALDAVDSILPAGTLSGASKLRACEIINELEKSPRGIYGGAIGYIDFAGNMDMCIAIRLISKLNNEITIRSGAGIVYDSIAENEYMECINKAKAVVTSMQEALGGIK